MTPPDNRLLNQELIESALLLDAPWSEGHGASGSYLGAGLLYYTLVYTARATRCVCIGSGGGFVPRMMRQAQRDLGLKSRSETHLVDANLPDAGWGAPKWIREDSFFRTEYSDIRIHLETSAYAAAHLFERQSIDYLHIDGDHTYDGCRHDFAAFEPLLSRQGVVTFHDTGYHQVQQRCGVHRVVDEIRNTCGYEVLDFPGLGRGVAIVRKTQYVADGE